MSDATLIILTVALSVAFGVIVGARTVIAERAAGNGGNRRREPTTLVHWLDRAGVVVTVLIVAAVVFRVVNTVM